MGICCSNYCNDDYYYDYKKNLPNYYTCYKCNDTFKVDTGGYSNRRSCRYHNFDNNNFCKDCHEFKHKITSFTCYHVKKFSITFWTCIN